MRKRWLANKEMSDPDWVHAKQQDYFALKAALQRFEWGAAFIPPSCQTSLWIIRREMALMDEPMKTWKAEKQRYIWIKTKRKRG